MPSTSATSGGRQSLDVAKKNDLAVLAVELVDGTVERVRHFVRRRVIVGPAEFARRAH